MHARRLVGCAIITLRAEMRIYDEFVDSQGTRAGAEDGWRIAARADEGSGVMVHIDYRAGGCEIEVTRQMIEAGVAELCGHDREFEPTEAAVFKVFRSMMLAHLRTRITVVAASEVETSLSPYLAQKSVA